MRLSWLRGWGLGLALAAAAALLLCGALAMAEEGESAGAEPPPPVNLSTRALWSGIVDVQWEAVAGAERYELQVFLLDRWVELPGAGIEAAYYGAGAVLRGLPPSRSLEVRVRSQNAAGSSDWSALLFVPQTDRPGAWSGVPEPSNAAATGRPRIVGRARVGERLEAETGAIADANGLERVRLHYQWTLSRGGEEREIAGATGASYTLTESELGERVGLRVWFWDRQGFYESLTSAATLAVEPWTHWSGRMTVGYADDGERKVPAIVVGGEVYGVGFGYGELRPTQFDWRGERVRVVVLGMHIDDEGEPSVHVMLSREMPDNYELHLGGRSFALSEATHPEAAGYAYQWDGERFSWTEGETVQASITSLYPPLILELTSSRQLCTANTLTELTWEITGGKPPYTLTIDGQAVDPEAESHRVNCGPLTIDPGTEEPLPNQTKTFSATVIDSQATAATESVNLMLPLVAPSLPPAPTMSLSGAAAGEAVELSWSKVITGSPISGYELQYQSIAWDGTLWPATWTPITETLGAEATGHRHDDLDPDQRYRYRLRASNSVGAGPWSRAFPDDGVQPKPGAPVLSAQTAASGSVLLSWEPGPASVTRWEYRIWEGDGDWGTWMQILNAGAATTSHKISGLTEDAHYSFQMRAVNASGDGPPSEAVTAVAGLTPTVPSDRETLRYDSFDSTGGSTSAGAYAFLTDASDLASGATTFAEVSGSVALLLNTNGYRDRDYASVLATVRAGDQITWYLYSTCWYHFRVTEVLADPAGASRKLFGVAFEAEDPCGRAGAEQRDSSFFDDFRSNEAWFLWDDPPSEPKVGSDGIRIMPFGYYVDGGHTYRLTGLAGPTAIVVNVPSGMRLKEVGAAWQSGGYLIVSYKDESSGRILWLDPSTGTPSGFDDLPYEGETEPPPDVVARFESIIASIRERPLP